MKKKKTTELIQGSGQADLLQSDTTKHEGECDECDSIGQRMYWLLVLRNFRVGNSTAVVRSGAEEEIRHRNGRGDLGECRVTVRRSNNLPQPVSGPAAAIFQHFIKIQYRDVRSSVIKQVLKDYVEGGGILGRTSKEVATTEAELAFWLHCAETRKPCVRLRNYAKQGKYALLYISVHCPQGCCFHPDALSHIGEIFLLNDRWDPNPWTLTGIEVSSHCSVKGGEAAAQAIVKQFAENSKLLVTDERDWLRQSSENVVF